MICNRRISSIFRDTFTKACPLCKAEIDDEQHLLFGCKQMDTLEAHIRKLNISDGVKEGKIKKKVISMEKIDKI